MNTKQELREEEPSYQELQEIRNSYFGVPSFLNDEDWREANKIELNQKVHEALAGKYSEQLIVWIQGKAFFNLK